MKNLSLGFIGLGAMGGAIAARLLGDGNTLTVWGRTPEKLRPWLDLGATQAPSPAALAEACDVVFLCVTDTAAVEEVVFGANGVASAIRADTLLADHSTIHPLATRRFAERLRSETGASWVDVPVTGGVPAAREGRLVIMAGGADDDIDSLRPIMECYSRRVTRMGENGTGQATKAVNQMLIAGTVAMVAEAFNFAVNFGVSARSLPDCLADGWADSAVLQDHARRMAAANYSRGGNATIMAKDVDIACDMGRETGSPMPMTAMVQQLYRRLIAEGNGEKGQIGLMWLYRQEPLP